MRKFYYVNIANAYEKEIREELDKVSCIRSLGYSEPSAIFLKGIRQAQGTRKVKGFIFEYDEKYYYDNPVPMICELRKTDKGQEYLMDIVTRSTYWKSNGGRQKLSENIILIPEKEISSDEVVKFLKSLTPDQAKLYSNSVLELKNAMYLGYHAYLRRVNADNRRQQENENFIDNFSKRHKK